MIEKVKDKYGLDSEDQETPFRKHWLAIIESNKSTHLTLLTNKVRFISHANAQSKHDVLNYLTDGPKSGNCPYYIKQFFSDFEKKKPTWDFSTKDGINLFKKSYLTALDKSYLWGKVKKEEIIEYWRHTEPIVSQIKNQSRMMRSQAGQGNQNVVPPENPQMVVSQHQLSNNQSNNQGRGNESVFAQNQGGNTLDPNIQRRQVTTTMNNNPQTTNHLETPGRNLFNERVNENPSINIHPPSQNLSVNQADLGIFY